MDPAKAKALLAWVNAVSDQCVESLQQLYNGKQLLKILKKIVNETFNEDEYDDAKERLKFIISYLQDIYRGQNLQVSWSKVCFDRDVREIGKLVALLLIQAVQCDNKKYFVDEIIKKDIDTQSHIMMIIEYILLDAKEVQLKEDYWLILTADNNPTTSMEMVMPGSPAVRMYTNSPIMEPSPVKMFFNSPQMSTKIALRKYKEQQKKLEATVSSETNLRQELEIELEEKNRAIVERDGKIHELKRQVHFLKPLEFEVEDLRNVKVIKEKIEEENERLKARLSELAQYKIESTRLEAELREITDEKYLLENSLQEKQKLVENVEQYRTHLHKANIEINEMKIKTSHMNEQINRLSVENNEIKQMYREREESYQLKIKDYEEKLYEQANQEPQKIGESLDLIMQQEKMELESEVKRLTAAYIDPDIVNQMTLKVKTLEANEQHYTASYKEAKTEVLSLQSIVQKLQSEVALKTDEIGQMTKSLQTQRDEGSKQVAQLTEESEKLKLTIQVIEKERGLLTEEKHKLEQELVQTQNELSMVRKDVQIYQTAVENQKMEADQLNTAKKTVEKQIKDQEEFFKGQIEALHKDLQRTKSEYEAREQELQQKLIDLQGAHHRLEMVKENENRTSQQELKSLRDEITALQTQKENLQKTKMNDVTLYQEEYRKMRSAFENEMTQKNSALEETNKKMAEMEEQFKNHVQKHGEELEAKDLQVKDLSQERDTLKNDVQRYQEEIEGKDSQIKNLSQERDNFHLNFENLIAELHKEIDKIKGQYSALLEESETLRNDKKMIAEECEQIKVEATRKIEEREKTFEVKLACFEEKSSSEANKLHKELSKNLDEAYKERDSVKQELFRARNELKNHCRLKEETEKKLKDSEVRGDQYKGKLMKLMSQHQPLQSTCEKQSRQLKECSEKIKKMSAEGNKLKIELENLKSECKTLQDRDVRMREETRSAKEKFMEEQKKNSRLSQRLQSLEVQLDHANRQIRQTNARMSCTGKELESYRNEKPQSYMNDKPQSYVNEKPVKDDHKVDHKVDLDNGFDIDNTLNLSDLTETSHGTFDTSDMFPSRPSSTTKRGGSIFEITLESHKSFDMSDTASMDFGNHTIPELASSTTSVGSTSVAAFGKHTTARAGFVLLNGCEDEPEHFDWGRVSELQRRNTLCLPHMRSAYPIETQYATPGKAEEKKLKENKTSGANDKNRKRKANYDENKAVTRKMRTSLSYQGVQDERRMSKTMTRQATSLQTLEENKRNHQREPVKPAYDKRESIAFSIGITPKKQKQARRKSDRLAKEKKQVK